LLSMIWEMMIEVVQAQQQKAHNVQPRIERRFPYPVVRAAATRFLPYLNAQLTVGKLFEGIEAAYVTFPSYDEVAHHSGTDRTEPFQILRMIDEHIHFITGAVKMTQRPYEFMLLSDHGQSMGATFRQRYGASLAELLRQLVGEEDGTHGATTSISE